MKLSQEAALRLLNDECVENFGCSLKEATKQQAYKALCLAVKNQLVKMHVDFNNEVLKKEKKQVYYMSMEFW